MREHYRRWQGKAAAKLEGKAARRAMTAGPAPEELGQLPDVLLDADSVALILTRSKGSTSSATSAAWMRSSPTPHWPGTAPLSPGCTSTWTTSRFRRWRSAAWCSATPRALTPSSARFSASPASAGRGTGRNCSAATRSPSSTTNRRRASRPLANVSPSFAAPPPGKTATPRRRERPRLRLSRGSRVRHLPGSGIGLALVRTVARRLGGEVNLRARRVATPNFLGDGGFPRRRR